MTVLSVHGGYTAAQGRKNRKALLRDLEKAERKRHAARMKELERDEHRAGQHRRAALGQAKERCSAGVTKAKDLASQRYAEAKAAAEAAWDLAREARIAEKKATRQAALDVCELDRAHVEAEEQAKIEAVRKKKEEEARFKRQMEAIARSGKSREKGRKKTSSAERRSESDDEIRASLPDGLIPLFEKTKRSIKGTDRMSRLEAFLHFAEENPGEALAAQQELADRELARLQAAYFQQAGGGAPRTRSKSRSAQPADVPF